MTTMKRIISALLILAFTLTLSVSFTPIAFAAEEGDYGYTIKNNTATIDYYWGDSDAVVIPDTLGGVAVTEINDMAFYACMKMKSVTIPNTVTNIGLMAFANCFALTSVSIPDNVTTIEDGAFNWDGALTQIVVGDLNISYASVDGVLFNKTKTTLIQYPCGKAGSYTVPDGVTTIQKYSFSEAEALTDVNIPADVTTIGEFAFGWCSALTQIVVADANTAFSSQNSILFDKDKSDIIQAPGKMSGDFVISTGVKVVRAEAFSNCTNITSVLIPSTVTSIQTMAFFGCSGLKKAVFLGNAPAAGEDVFMYAPASFKLFYVTGKKGFGTALSGQKTSEAVTFDVITDKSTAISGYTIPGSTVEVKVGTSIFSIQASSAGKWSKNLSKKIGVATKLSATVAADTTVNSVKTTVVIPSVPTVHKITSKSKTITGDTYSKVKVSLKVSGVWRTVTATSKGAFALKLSKTLKAGSSVVVKVKYKSINSIEKTIKVY